MVKADVVFVMGSFVAACSARVDRLPRPGESLLASHFVLEPGGKGFNLAVGARRLGVEVDGMLAIGNDLFADFAKAAMQRAELRQDMLVQFAGPTGAGIGFIDAEGENCLAVFPGANASLSAADVLQAAHRISAAGLVLAQFEIGDAAVASAFALARKANVTTLLNPSPYREILPEILGNTSILVVNQVEADCLARQFALATDSDEARASLAQVLFAKGVGTVVVTLGAQGVWVSEMHSVPFRQQPFKAEVLDTLGAGDAFIAAFAAGFVEGAGLAQCVRWGAAAGAAATLHPGVFAALPSRAGLDLILLNQAEC